jgi:hypothetical protein
VKLWFEEVRRQLFMHRPFALRRSVTNALASRTRNHFLYLICMGCNPGIPPPSNLTGRFNLIQVAILVPVHFARISLGGFLVGITSATAVAFVVSVIRCVFAERRTVWRDWGSHVEMIVIAKVVGTVATLFSASASVQCRCTVMSVCVGTCRGVAGQFRFWLRGVCCLVGLGVFCTVCLAQPPFCCAQLFVQLLVAVRFWCSI